MQRLLREPLLHFFMLGALLFGIYSVFEGSSANARDEIIVSNGQIDSLRAQFERVWQRQPTSTELQGLVESWVREEIFYREGLAMGLDRDDPVVRRRVGQKLEFIVDGATPPVPTNTELQAWLDTHAAKYAIEGSYSLRQIYFNSERRGRSLEADAMAAKKVLESGTVRALASVGDATLLPAEMTDIREFEIERAFGSEFANSLPTVSVGGWHPVRSGFGMHLVEVIARTESRAASLVEARAAIERDLLQAKTQAAKEAVYGRIRSNYTVRIEGTGETKQNPRG